MNTYYEKRFGTRGLSYGECLYVNYLYAKKGYSIRELAELYQVSELEIRGALQFVVVA